MLRRHFFSAAHQPCRNELFVMPVVEWGRYGSLLHGCFGKGQFRDIDNPGIDARRRAAWIIDSVNRWNPQAMS
jgi:hypothetical protein